VSNALTIIAYDATGKVVFQKTHQNLNSGSQWIELPSENWSAGLYSIRVIADQKQYLLNLVRQ
jgi:hypothetical protein